MGNLSYILDKVIQFLKNHIHQMREEYRTSVDKLPEWQLDSFLDKRFASKSINEKRNILERRYLSNDMLYSIILDDLALLEGNKLPNLDLKLLNIDDGLLESQGYSEEKKAKTYSFIAKLRSMLNQLS